MRLAVCILVIAVFDCTSSCQNDLVPLYRLYSERRDDYLYTTSLDEVNNATKTFSYHRDGLSGWVAKTASDCLCGNQFKAVHRLYRKGEKIDDHYYTQIESEVDICIKKLDYIYEGIAFYCPISANGTKCGASKPLHEYWRGLNHFYTTDKIEANVKVIANGGQHYKVLCDIWLVNAPNFQTTLDNLVPLYRLNRQDFHFYATNENANIAVSFYGYELGGSPGQVATSSKDCHCGNNLQPIHKLMKFKGLKYYCATTFGECDATIPLYKYWSAKRHFYTTDIDEGNQTAAAIGGIFEGIYCYIWKSK